MRTTLEIQQQLKARGYDPGDLDGDFGPITRTALMRFERTVAHLTPDGYPDAESIAALFGEPVADKPRSATPWVDEMLRKKGLHENRNYTELSQWLRSDGKTLGDPRKYPWCGDGVETAIARTLGREGLPSNPYLARNWLKFGIPCDPRYGAIGVYWRGSKSGESGHVAFIVGEDKAAGTYLNLGCNQSNSISVAPIAKSRLLGARWPRSVPMGRLYMPQMKGGKISVNEH